jgi:WD repeat-containing protein 91
MSLIDSLSSNSSSNQNSSVANTLITSNVLYTQSSSTSQQANGTTSVALMDELVKEYLIFRGFNQTVKSFEHDLKNDKDRGFKADKITDQLLSFVYSYDLSGLLDYWSYLEHKFFSKITLKLSNTSSTALTRKYELFLLRFYLIHALQTSKTEKAFELFENYGYKLQSQSEWREWYCLPFLKNPEENPTFSIYFSKNWIDTFIVSLQNFLNITFQSVQFPRLLNYDEDSFWKRQASSQKAQLQNVNFLLNFNI